MAEGTNISYLVAFVSGILIFFSPCLLPLIPSYIFYITGTSISVISDKNSMEKRKKFRAKVIIHSIAFIIGFSVVFVLLGAGATFLGGLLVRYQPVLKKFAAVLIILFGLIIMGVFRIPFLEKERRITYKAKGISALNSFIIGATFAFAWTPCVGPILGSILAYASSTASMKLGVKLLSVFSLGIAVPFFISALIVNYFLAFIRKLEKFIRWINIIGGVILITFGVFVLAGRI